MSVKITGLDKMQKQLKEVVDWPPESPDNQYHLFK